MAWDAATARSAWDQPFPSSSRSRAADASATRPRGGRGLSPARRAIPGGVDLLVATTTLAAQSARAGDIFDPFPCVNWPNSEELALDPTHRDQHLPLAREVLSKFPSSACHEQVLASGDIRDIGLRTLLHSCHELCHPLFLSGSEAPTEHTWRLCPRTCSSQDRHQLVMVSAPLPAEVL